ncbi:hypothetical protein BC332_14899 [Capsicum chinense]|nr:hypothetical protein BC332_14899 [Capsicum chinense]
MASVEQVTNPQQDLVKKMIGKAQDGKFNEEVLKTIPLWVKLPNLALNCWSKDNLNRIGNGLGRPLYADNCTTNAKRISYVHILVEMDVTRLLPGSIVVCVPEGGIVDQAVIYDWKPS